MTATRHWFVRQPLVLPAPLDSQLSEAAKFELAGNWYLAGETYVALKNRATRGLNAIERAKVLARAASCFELARDSKVSARIYEEAAQEIAVLGSDPQLAAELSNRAALQFRDASEFLFAGQAWVRTAEEFSKIGAMVINCTENFTPLPMSALKSHLCGVCFEAAADAYAMAYGNEMMSVGAYWRAAKAYSEGLPNIQAFEAFRRSLSAHIRQYGTLELEHLRRSVPLSRDERAASVNPLEVMEAALARCNNHHQQTPGDTPQSRLQTNRQMTSVYHDFALALLAAGNAREAGQFRAFQKDRQRLILTSEGNYFSALLYQIWRFTSNYGESIGRWSIACLLVILLFALTYYGLNVIESTVSPNGAPLHAFDYVYFSVITFTTLGYGDLHPIGLLGQALSCLEVFAGFIMFGVLLSFVGTRFQQG